MVKRKITKEEKIVRLLDYLKKYTDEDNPASIPQIERYFRKQGYENFFGTKDTRKNMIKALTVAMNSDINGELLPREQWRVVYDDFLRENTAEKDSSGAHHIVNLYYRKPFRDHEVKTLLESIEKNDTLSEKERTALIGKIKENLTNENYMKRPLTPAQRRAEELQQERFDARMKAVLERKRREQEWHYD